MNIYKFSNIYNNLFRKFYKKNRIANKKGKRINDNEKSKNRIK